ncbi:hypothetical protein ASD32_04450 [Rhizobium sp. Root483D2]|nr:hypothetical protein ASD32_04450 [Rhizobium sp. Root483D2]
MIKKRPSPAQLRLWLARINANGAKGVSIEETANTFNEMMKCWEAVEGIGGSDNDPTEGIKPTKS